MDLHTELPRRKREKHAQKGEHLLHSTKQPMASAARSNDDGHIIPEFINITNSFSLNSNSRSSIRAQVMRNYHRRRIQKRNGQRSTSPNASSIPVLLNAKEQTHKFRIDGGSSLRFYRRGTNRVRKLVPRTEQNARPQVSRNEQNLEWKLLGDIQVALSKSTSATDNLNYSSYTLSTSREGGPTETSYEIQFRKVEELLLNIKVSLALPPLCRAVAPGVLDPFSAMSLLITPRTQLLLHHYC